MKNRTLLTRTIISLILICGIFTNCKNIQKQNVSDNLEALIINCLEKNDWQYYICEEPDSSDTRTILTRRDNIELRISIHPESNSYSIMGYIDTIVPDSSRTATIIAANDYNNMGPNVPVVITDYGLILFRFWQHTDCKCFNDGIFMDDLYLSLLSIEYGTNMILDNIEENDGPHLTSQPSDFMQK